MPNMSLTKEEFLFLKQAMISIEADTELEEELHHSLVSKFEKYSRIPTTYNK